MTATGARAVTRRFGCGPADFQLSRFPREFPKRLSTSDSDTNFLRTVLGVLAVTLRMHSRPSGNALITPDWLVRMLC